MIEGLEPGVLLFLALAGLAAGFVDAVVGGGGLIQLPALLVALPGAAPVQLLATNKLGSIMGTTTSSLTYYRRVRPDLRTALLRALADGPLQSAALDVFETEPIPAGSPLLSCENVVLTPHASWYSEESYSELKRRVAEAVAAVASGERPRDILNPEVLETGRRPAAGG